MSKKGRWNTSGSGSKMTQKKQSLEKTRRRPRSEAFTKHLFLSSYDTGRALRKSPQSLGVGGLKQNKPKVIDGQTRLVNVSMNFPELNQTALRETQAEICRDRQERRRVLFASGKAGKIKVKEAQWKLSSLVRCN